MSSYAAFLRAINVGGRRVTNDRLRAVFEDLGYTDVVTIQAAGTVAFGSTRRSPATVATHLSAGLEDALGYEATAFVRSARQVADIVDAAPFEAGAGAKIHVTFLPAAPSAAQRRAVEALGVPGDELAVVGSELFWRRAGPMMESALDQKAVAAALGKVPTTTRTLATVAKTAARLDP